MKPKNIMLLGFVNKAVDYLDRHMDEEPDARLAELKNIDLASIREELNDNLDASLGTMQSTMSTLLKAGNEAFDKFIEDNLGKDSIPDQFNRIFDVDFDAQKKKSQDDLAKLLAFYNLDDDFDIDDNDIEASIVENDVADISEDDEFLQEIKKNVTSDDTNDITPIEHSDVDTTQIDSIFSEIVKNENQNNEKKVVEQKPVVEDKTEVNNTQTYISSLISDLRNQLKAEEEEKRNTEIKNNEVYERISSIYQYIPQGFLKSVYELKENLAVEYPVDRKVVVLHRVIFRDVDNLRKFVEIGINHGYTINADEKKMIVDIFKEFVNADGKILTNIYDVANQGYLLKGEYEGYNVIVEED